MELTNLTKLKMHHLDGRSARK